MRWGGDDHGESVTCLWLPEIVDGVTTPRLQSRIRRFRAASGPSERRAYQGFDVGILGISGVGVRRIQGGRGVLLALVLALAGRSPPASRAHPPADMRGCRGTRGGLGNAWNGGSPGAWGWERGEEARA